MKRRRAAGGAGLLGLTALLLIAGCSRERIDWKSAEAADTIQSYNRFLERHPDSELAPQARARMAQLTEDKDWQRAVAADTVAAYETFLQRHSAGKWAEEARIRIESFALEGNPSPLEVQNAEADAAPPPTSAPATTSAPAAVKPITVSDSTQPTPTPQPAATRSATAPSDSTAIRGFGIQLGAFSTQSAALSEWKRLESTYSRELRGLRPHAVRAQTAAGTLFRLQSPVEDETKARAICAALVKRTQPCVVVLPQSR
ncbi:MAG: SPOR domain-containing protein [Steroidobacteraceae bacterium]|nr:SPOR domain-containing protein [Steroidobacteraceae bacterium]